MIPISLVLTAKLKLGSRGTCCQHFERTITLRSVLFWAWPATKTAEIKDLLIIPNSLSCQLIKVTQHVTQLVPTFQLSFLRHSKLQQKMVRDILWDMLYCRQSVPLYSSYKRT